MSYGTTASLICPACGQAFLTMQHSMESMTQCPHCAHSALRAHFGTQAQVVGITQVRRRISHASPPEEIPAPQVHAPPPQPTAWEAPPVPKPAAFIARGHLQHGQALLPVGDAPPPQAYSNSSHSSGSSGRNILLIAAVVVAIGGLGGWLWLDQNPSASVGATPVPRSPAPEAPLEIVRKAQIVVPPTSPLPLVVMPDTAAYDADAKILVTNLFAATTAEARGECIHEGKKHSAEIEALFGPGAAEKIELRQLAQIPGVSHMLSSGQPALLFKLVTSRCPNGALLRLETGADDKRRIFWPLLMETHQALLNDFLKKDTAEPAWFHVVMRPSHGFDLPAGPRARYFTFDTQVSAANDTHFVACVDRDSPLGRFMDRGSDWGKIYLARLLVRRLDLEADARCFIIVDCEGARQR